MAARVAESHAGPQPLTVPATAFALLLAALWGGNAVAIKAGLDDAPPLRLAAFRFIAGGLVIVAWTLATRQPFWPTRRELRPLGVVAALFVAQIAFMNIGQKHTTAGHGVVILSTFPLWTGIFAHFFVPGDRLSTLRVAGSLLAYGGILLVFWQSFGAGGQALGDLLILCAAVVLGLSQVYLSLAAQGIGLPKLLLTQIVVGVPTFLVAGLLFEEAPWVATQHLALSVFYQGVVIAGFGFIGNLWLLKHYLPSGVSALSLTTPVWGVLFSHIVLGEGAGPALFGGLALVLAGSAVVRWSAAKGR